MEQNVIIGDIKISFKFNLFFVFVFIYKNAIRIIPQFNFFKLNIKHLNF